MSMGDEVRDVRDVLVRDAGGVRTLTLNRPDKLNALNLALTKALVAELERANDDESVGCVILTGAGRGFCAGADLNEFSQLTGDNPELVQERSRLTTRLHGLFPHLRIPIVSAINGVAVGGGAGLATAADVVIAADHARFGYPEITHGIVAAIVMTNLVRLVGQRKAFELVATGDSISADEALAAGMINRVVGADRLMAVAMSFAERLASSDRVAMTRTKRLLRRVADLPFDEALEEGRRANEEMRGPTSR